MGTPITNKTVAVLGASNDHTKYAFKAMHMLKSHGFNPIPVNPNEETVIGLKAYASLRDIPEPIDTVTIYVRPEISSKLRDDILAVKPRRIIMNPTTENDELAEAAEAQGIEVVRACTLVMLTTGAF
jgi:predicted CoA-binding protein